MASFRTRVRLLVALLPSGLSRNPQKRIKRDWTFIWFKGLWNNIEHESMIINEYQWIHHYLIAICVHIFSWAIVILAQLKPGGHTPKTALRRLRLAFGSLARSAGKSREPRGNCRAQPGSDLRCNPGPLFGPFTEDDLKLSDCSEADGAHGFLTSEDEEWAAREKLRFWDQQNHVKLARRSLYCRCMSLQFVAVSSWGVKKSPSPIKNGMKL